MIIKECPRCGSDDISTYWVKQRKLQPRCNDCHWKGEPITPENREIKNTKEVLCNSFEGFHFEAYDKYGHIICSSRSYDTEKDAVEEINKEIEIGKRDEYAGPYTVILWPDVVTITGKIIR
jgi:hypothetical protein